MYPIYCMKSFLHALARAVRSRMLEATGATDWLVVVAMVLLLLLMAAGLCGLEGRNHIPVYPVVFTFYKMKGEET